MARHPPQAHGGVMNDTIVAFCCLIGMGLCVFSALVWGAQLWGPQ